jgi:hypothetical protein
MRMNLIRQGVSRGKSLGYAPHRYHLARRAYQLRQYLSSPRYQLSVVQGGVKYLYHGHCLRLTQDERMFAVSLVL